MEGNGSDFGERSESLLFNSSEFAGTTLLVLVDVLDLKHRFIILKNNTEQKKVQLPTCWLKVNI